MLANKYPVCKKEIEIPILLAIFRQVKLICVTRKKII